MNALLLGFGTVGRGFYELLSSNQGGIRLCGALIRRQVENIGCMVSDDYYKLLRESGADTVVEAMGGLEPTYEYISAALRTKKHVVTANKQLMCAYYDELTSLARENGVSLRCSAAVGGGIPWLDSLSRAANVDSITDISGIMNGTSNYILDSMQRQSITYEAALKTAQQLGYAEADPTADVCGYDTRRKLALSINIAFGVSIKEADIPCRGIESISSSDIDFFKENDLACRFIGHAKRRYGSISASVEPVLFSLDAQPSKVFGCDNLFSLTAAHIGTQSFFGAGAGAYPTGSNIFADCISIADGNTAFYTDSFTPADIVADTAPRRYYVRTSLDGRITPMLDTAEANELFASLNAGDFVAAVDTKLD